MAMVQFNLLPDVKLAYIKAERQKQIVLAISVILGIGSIVLFVLLFSFVNIAQKKSINDLTSDITSKSRDLTSTKDLSKVLTVQNQINSLASLHDQKVVSTRILDYTQKMTPDNVTIERMEVDYVAGTLKIDGAGLNLVAINTFADALKFTKYTISDDDGKKSPSELAFSEVVLSSVNVSEDELPEYSITVKFKPDLFVQSNKVDLEVPKQVTTRSVTERPDALFDVGGN
jgi:hypothetical protein